MSRRALLLVLVCAFPFAARGGEPAKTKKTPAARPGGKPKARQKAALPPAGTPLAPGRAMQIAFKSTTSKLPDTAKAGLKTLAAKLKGQPALRLQLMAYAGGESLSSGKARRLSLSRALSVRSYLIENGVRSTRIDVRALGNKTRGTVFIGRDGITETVTESL